ncbi:hypothetical protein WMY93_024846 [Mugilogobius chulae]|uniref:Ubiquitin-like protease family profile domain-containing protein n=1 Tax=Mugilogobius chulae TaxID=88201 RepID=A0AAW0N0V1_9GOBI
MVHSGFSSPMNATSALPLPASTTASSVVLPPADSTEQTLPQTPTKPTCNSDSTNVVTPSNADTPINNDSSSVLSTLTPTPAQPVFNGRTSGRKRTPKSCACCGPKGHGHNVQTSNRGGGRARGRPRGRGGAANLEETPKRKLGGLLTHIKSFDLTNEDIGEIEDIKNIENEETLVAKESVNNSDVEMKVLDKADDMVQSPAPEKTNSVPLSNGNTATPKDDSQEVIASKPPVVPPPPKDPITVSNKEHPWALRDHRMYCRLGTWDKVDQTDDKTLEEHLNDESQQQEVAAEQLLDMIHDFLESFYLKYGSFIPLAENDVVEHLKKTGKSDLSNTGLDIQKEVKQYRAGLASAPVAGFMVTHNRHTLSLEDLSTLEDQNWINDQIINMYGELIMEASGQKVHFFNSFFHKQLVAKGYEGVKRWTKKIDLFSKSLVLIPIHLEIHWSLVTVSMAHKTISYYDSQGIVFRHTTENIMKYLLAEAKEKKQTAFQKGWKITIIKIIPLPCSLFDSRTCAFSGIPQQKNDSDCGVFVLEYCRCLSVKQAFRFSQEDMPRIRKRIYKELCECRLDV